MSRACTRARNYRTARAMRSRFTSRNRKTKLRKHNLIPSNKKFLRAIVRSRETESQQISFIFSHLTRCDQHWIQSSLCRNFRPSNIHVSRPGIVLLGATSFLFTLSRIHLFYRRQYRSHLIGRDTRNASLGASREDTQDSRHKITVSNTSSVFAACDYVAPA